MRFLRPTYLKITSPGGVPSTEEFLSVFEKINLNDDSFVIDTFKPGTGGESSLYHALVNRGFLNEAD